MKLHSSHEIRRAVRRIRRKLKRHGRFVDLQESRRSKRALADLERTPGFLVRIPGIGQAVALKPETLTKWVKGTSLNRVVDALDHRGKLIRGADGGASRQVQIGDRRQRLYCFAVGSSVGPIPKRSKEDDYANYESSDDVARRREEREALRAARSREMPLRRIRRRPRFPSGKFPSWNDESDVADWGTEKGERGMAAIKSPGRPVQLLHELISKKKRD